MIVTDCPWSITTDVGTIVTVGVVSTVTAAFVVGVAVGVGLDPPVVPVSVMVTVRTHVAVGPVGAYASVAAPEFENPGQLPDLIDQT